MFFKYYIYIIKHTIQYFEGHEALYWFKIYSFTEWTHIYTADCGHMGAEYVKVYLLFCLDSILAIKLYGFKLIDGDGQSIRFVGVHF